jgi:hypothetical protein
VTLTQEEDHRINKQTVHKRQNQYSRSVTEARGNYGARLSLRFDKACFGLIAVTDPMQSEVC